MASTPTSVFAKVKHQGVKAKAFDAEGNEVEFDVRDDEEQSVKLDEIVELLLAAGYFRARIKGLSPFDKVVGGMTWCLTASNVDVDVDLLFQENSTIKQKIALTEKIVAALKRMKCPHRLEPYQIQGLDFIHIYPVVQWLVKKAIETREEMNLQIRARAMLEYKKQANTAEDDLSNTTKAIAAVKDAYKPRRQFRAPAASTADRETRVQMTLLEYGRRYGMSRQPKAEASDKKAAVAKSLGAAEGPDLAEMEEKRVRSLMSSFSETAGQNAISTASLGNIVSLQQAAIAQLSGEYAAEAAQRASADSERADGLAAHKRRLAGLQKQIEQASKKIETLEAEHAAAATTHRETVQAAKKVAAKTRELKAMQEELDRLEGDEGNKVILAKLRGLVSLNESLKQQEQQFKATCKTEAAALQAKISQLRGEGVEVVDIDDERARAIAAQYEEDLKKLQKIRQLSARRARETVVLQRKIDDVPSRAELTQYQRRFVELYEQVAAKHRETKQHFGLYNTLCDVRQLMDKEISQLSSIHDNFALAMSSTSNKEKFLDQVNAMVTGLKGNLDRVEEKHTGEKQKRDKLSDTYLQLVEMERQYFKAVKDHEAECNKNETLLAKLKKRSA